LDVERGDGADQQRRAQHMSEIGERVEPCRTARRRAEAGLLERRHGLFDGGKHFGSAQFDDFAADGDPFRPHLVLSPRRRIALDDDLCAGLEHVLREAARLHPEQRASVASRCALVLQHDMGMRVAQESVSTGAEILKTLAAS
jgi:hypothetical protein